MLLNAKLSLTRELTYLFIARELFFVTQGLYLVLQLWWRVPEAFLAAVARPAVVLVQLLVVGNVEQSELKSTGAHLSLCLSIKELRLALHGFSESFVPFMDAALDVFDGPHLVHDFFLLVSHILFDLHEAILHFVVLLDGNLSQVSLEGGTETTQLRVRQLIDARPFVHLFVEQFAMLTLDLGLEIFSNHIEPPVGNSDSSLVTVFSILRIEINKVLVHVFSLHGSLEPSLRRVQVVNRRLFLVHAHLRR